MLVAFVGAVALALAAPGPTFVDPADDASGAPDVRTVVVSPAATELTFTIQASGSWTSAAAILRIDSDADPATGNAFGGTGFEAVYVLHSLHDQFTLERPNGVTLLHPQATWSLSGSTLTISAPLSELGPLAPTIGFRVSTPAPAGADEAPDGGSEWRFAPRATIDSIEASFTSRRPRHGQAFALLQVTTRFSDGNTGTAPAKCTARLGKTTLRGACRWRLPSSSRGKKLTVSVAAATKRRTYIFRVR